MSLALGLHIPDGFLPPPLCAVGWLLAVPAVARSLKSSSSSSELDRRVPLMGMLAAFTFVVQSLQFPVPGGTSAHLQGSALLALALGPGASLLVLSLVIAMQALIFGDGGLLVLGWNLVNMAVVGPLGACSAAWIGQKLRLQPMVWSFLAGWLSLELSTLAACLELSAAGTSPLKVSLLGMLPVQGLVGLGEGLATAAALAILRQRRQSAELGWREAVPGILVTAAMLICLPVAWIRG
jgi:cobalt/nickel transport system permease protein